MVIDGEQRLHRKIQPECTDFPCAILAKAIEIDINYQSQNPYAQKNFTAASNL